MIEIGLLYDASHDTAEPTVDILCLVASMAADAESSEFAAGLAEGQSPVENGIQLDRT